MESKCHRKSEQLFFLNFELTLKAFDAPSIATATGPTLATAASRFDSLPLAMETVPEILAPRLLLS